MSRRPAQPAEPAPPEKTALEQFLSGGMSGGYERIQSTLYALDPIKEFDRLTQGLSFDKPASQVEFGHLVDALDRATDNLYRASALLAHCKVAHDAFQVDVQVLESSLYDEAYRALQAEKDAGKRSKAISEADVRAAMSQRHPDSVRENEARLSKAKRLVEHVERLHDCWKVRARALDTMVATSRR